MAHVLLLLEQNKFSNQTKDQSTGLVTNYASLERIIQDIINETNGERIRLCDFHTLLFEKMPETTQWPLMFNKLPASIAPFISVDYSKLDRMITFRDLDHLHQKTNNYVQSMNPNDAKLRENVMQQFYRSKSDKLPLQTLCDSLNVKWTVLLNKLINIFSIDFRISTPRTTPKEMRTERTGRTGTSSGTQQMHSVNLQNLQSAANITVHHPAMSPMNLPENIRRMKPIEQGLVLLSLKYKGDHVPIHNVQQILYNLTDRNLLYTSNLMQSLSMLGLGKVSMTTESISTNPGNESFVIPTVHIKGWNSKLEQIIMNAFLSSLPSKSTPNMTTTNEQIPCLSYIRESAFDGYLADQFVSGGSSRAMIFRTLTDTLWTDLYTDIIGNVNYNFNCSQSEISEVNYPVYRFALKPMRRRFNLEEDKQIDGVLNDLECAPEKVMKLSAFQCAFYRKYNMFMFGEQIKRPFSEYLASKPRLTVLPLKDGDYLITFKSHSVWFIF